MKTIQELLNETKSYEERLSELETLIPQLNESEKIYYDGNKYVYKEDNEIFCGSDNYPKDSKVNGSFPFIFFLEALYLAKSFAEEYNNNEELKNNKSLHLNKFGLIEMKDYGVVGNKNIIKSFLNKKETTNVA